MIAIIDVGGGNLQSVQNALTLLGYQSFITVDSDRILSADRVIIPGVGNFGYIMQQIRKRKIDSLIQQLIQQNTPLLGICVGLQIFFESSEEDPGNSGLALFSGKIVGFTNGKIPQIGWNYVSPRNDSILQPGYAYFVNSFYARPQDPSLIIGETEYYTVFPSAIKKDSIMAVQFHPEKSGPYGLDFLRRWILC